MNQVATYWFRQFLHEISLPTFPSTVSSLTASFTSIPDARYGVVSSGVVGSDRLAYGFLMGTDPVVNGRALWSAQGIFGSISRGLIFRLVCFHDNAPGRPGVLPATFFFNFWISQSVRE